MAYESQAGAASVLAQGVEGLAKGIMSRDQVKVAREQSKADLAKLKHEEQTGSIQQQIDVANQQNQDLTRKLDKSETYDALRRYKADSNPRHINNMFKSNTRIAEAMGVTEIAKLDPYSSADMQMIVEAGGDPEDFKSAGLLEDSEEAQLARDFHGRYVKSRMSNGEWKVTDMNNVYAGTGFSQTMDDEELKQLLLKNKLQKSVKEGETKEGPLERDAKVVAAAKKRLADGTSTDLATDQEIVKFGVHHTAGVKPGQADIAKETKDLMVESFGGADKFFATDFSDPKNFQKAWDDVSKIMKTEGTELTAPDRKAIHEIRTLTALGEPGSQLTDKETGVMDHLLLKVKKYMDDEIGGIEATSAYAAFRNTVRHALYGAALTEAEITSFNEAFGTLGQKLGPVLQQLKTSISQVKAKLDSIAQLNNPYVAKVLLGADQVQLDNMLAAMQERIDYLSDKEPAAPKMSIKEAVAESLRKRGVTPNAK